MSNMIFSGVIAIKITYALFSTTKKGFNDVKYDILSCHSCCMMIIQHANLLDLASSYHNTLYLVLHSCTLSCFFSIADNGPLLRGPKIKIFVSNFTNLAHLKLTKTCRVTLPGSSLKLSKLPFHLQPFPHC